MPIPQDKFNEMIQEIKKNSEFHSVPFDFDMDDTQIKTLADTLATYSAVQRLHCTLKDPYAMKPLANLLKINSTLQVLELRSKGDSKVDDDIYRAELGTLADALDANTSIRTLRCRDLNTMGILPFLLETNTNIRTLDIPVYGEPSTIEPLLLHLVPFLKSNTTLQILKFRYFQLGDKGAAAIGEVLEKNSTLQELYLPLLETSGVGMTALAEGLKKNHVLKKLDIDQLPGHYTETAAKKEDPLVVLALKSGYDGVINVSYHVDNEQMTMLFHVLATNKTIQLFNNGKKIRFILDFILEQEPELESKERKDTQELKRLVEVVKQTAKAPAQSALTFSAGAAGAGAPQTASALLQSAGAAKESKPVKKVQFGPGGSSSDS